MKHLFIAGVTALCFLMPAIPALSADQSADAAAADQAAALQKMQEQLKQMQQQMDQIQKTKDPAKRSALMHQHWQGMMHGMQMMNQWGGPMMGMMGRGGPGCCTGGMHGQMMNPEMMQNRMDMMQMMMDQMMQHQQMLQPSK